MDEPLPEPPERPEQPERPEMPETKVRRTPRRAVRPASSGELPVPPEQTSDDTDAGGGDWREAGQDDDERYLRERPPHW